MSEDYIIIPAQEKYIKSFWQTLDEVCHEKIYLARESAFPLEQTFAFVNDCIINDYPTLFVLSESDKVVGWCEIVAKDNNNDVGHLGMGLLKEYRGQGIGKKLIKTAIKNAKEYGFSFIELSVRKSNLKAINLYEHIGFENVHTTTDGITVAGITEDVIEMKLTL